MSHPADGKAPTEGSDVSLSQHAGALLIEHARRAEESYKTVPEGLSEQQINDEIQRLKALMDMADTLNASLSATIGCPANDDERIYESIAKMYDDAYWQLDKAIQNLWNAREELQAAGASSKSATSPSAKNSMASPGGGSEEGFKTPRQQPGQGMGGRARTPEAPCKVPLRRRASDGEGLEDAKRELDMDAALPLADGRSEGYMSSGMAHFVEV
jgi:hypothetical protein